MTVIGIGSHTNTGILFRALTATIPPADSTAVPMAVLTAAPTTDLIATVMADLMADRTDAVPSRPSGEAPPIRGGAARRGGV
ncbi:hypothetical protein GCM10022252_40890 [Streptosporangium oxazolinicum]|uniref:Uncharacterized protein n=1 Tax=Streptosporangium oxazolinicum TaxID=909287 RepID=A0ABP8B0S6_9ACTN